MIILCFHSLFPSPLTAQSEVEGSEVEVGERDRVKEGRIYQDI